ncbi:unnamed protein product, partial [Ectocarpus fasciculatus]
EGVLPIRNVLVPVRLFVRPMSCQVGLPSIARRFSGKPILIYGKESSVVKGPGYVELDLNAHAFSYVGRKGLYVTLEKWKRAVFRIGFLLEGRTDEEQPEHILGC